MADSAASELASTLQSSHVDKHPDPSRDLNPSTSTSKRVPVHVTDVERDPRNLRKSNRRSSSASSDPSEVPISILEPLPRPHSNLPPLPDLRFEQSYLASIQTCNTASSVAWVTFVDHLIKPLTQGIIWHLATFGWRAWHTGVKFQGQGVGAKIRRWWWGVNGWSIPQSHGDS